MTSIDSPTLDFLRRLKRWDGVATSNDLAQVVDRKEDRMRQWCRRNGLVTYQRSPSPARWVLTEAGSARLAELERTK